MYGERGAGGLRRIAAFRGIADAVRRRSLGVAAVVLLIFAPAAEGQFFGPLERLFERVDGLTIYGTMGGLASSDHLRTDGFLGMNALRGMGVEVLIDVSRRSSEPPDVTPPDDGEADADQRSEDPPVSRWGIELGLGSTT